MSLTLKQYLNKYQDGRQDKQIPPRKSSIHKKDNQLQKMFNLKLEILKNYLRRYLPHVQIYSALVIELEELKKMFHQMFLIAHSKRENNHLEDRQKSIQRSRTLLINKQRKCEPMPELNDQPNQVVECSKEENQYKIQKNSNVCIEIQDELSEKIIPGKADSNNQIPKLDDERMNNCSEIHLNIHAQQKNQVAQNETKERQNNDSLKIGQTFQVIEPPQLSRMTSCQDSIRNSLPKER